MLEAMELPETNFEFNLPDHLTEHQKKEFREFLIRNREMFATSMFELGACNLNKFTIITTTEKPIYQHPYRKSERERLAIKQEIEKMLKAKIIQPSNSPWSAPVLMIPKKNGEYRFCIDFRKLNTITEQDSFPLPRIDDILDRLVQFMYASTLDLKMGKRT